MKCYLLLSILCLSTAFLFSQKNHDATGNEIYAILKTQDSMLFNAVFETYDTNAINALISDDFEFYHDQGGIMDTKAGFVLSISNIHQLSYKPTRKLREGSLQVYPLYDNGLLYGAIQSGEHEFYAIEGDKPPYLTSTAKFTHLWILEDVEWRLKRVLSYDHKTP